MALSTKVKGLLFNFFDQKFADFCYFILKRGRKYISFSLYVYFLISLVHTEDVRLLKEQLHERVFAKMKHFLSVSIIDR